GCCEGVTARTPVQVINRPGLSAIAYRAGTHSQFKQSMMARLSAADLPQLAGLRTSDDDDFTIALLDAWATVADVLTFYQERIANESYLLTATERRSLLELGRLIGYELRPGVAANTYLAFTLETGPGTPGKATIDAGSKVQSVPGPGEKPQTFETVEKIEARAEWNEIKPRITLPQQISADMVSVVLAGTNTNLKQGDRLLIVTATAKKFRRIESVEVNHGAQQTTVKLATAAAPPAAVTIQMVPRTLPNLSLVFQPFTRATVKSAVLDRTWRHSDLASYAYVQGWSMKEVAITVATHLAVGGVPEKPDTGVFAFRAHASLFGYNAPPWQSMPGEIKTAIQNPTHPNIDWPDPDPRTSKVLQLDRVYSEVIPDSWAVVAGSNSEVIARVTGSRETAASGNTLSGKITEITLDKDVALTTYSQLRETTIYAQSEKLDLAEIRLADPVSSNSIELDKLCDKELKAGQRVVVTGTTLNGNVRSESVELTEPIDNGGRTILNLKTDLKNQYKWEGFSINANIALATHGETVEEVLGSGDASAAYQHFTLRDSPLTYLSADNETGVESTLELRVNDLLWREAPALYGQGSKERVYVARNDDSGKMTVRFGDGRTGARVPTGSENITARYRKGIGREGLVSAGQLSLLMTRPLGVKGVTNPIDAGDAADPETIDDARPNAPLTVLTLGRVVSLRDYEDFARAFPGIAKASATWTWNGMVRGVFVTIAGTEGAMVDPVGVLYGHLLSAMRNAGDPFVQLSVRTYRRALFRVSAGVKVASSYKQDLVIASVERALRSRFSFRARSFGQGVALSEVVAAMQAVPGVLAVDVDALHRFAEPALPNHRLPAAAPQAGSDGTVLAAELLTLDPNAPIDLKVIL
ncbi:MAG TPA: putative baseplate assembly protein, partial [Blastocatellia bacterium]|nr:putative baseplate assembly protein [Blastocatellia bacterium]